MKKKNQYQGGYECPNFYTAVHSQDNFFYSFTAHWWFSEIRKIKNWCLLLNIVQAFHATVKRQKCTRKEKYFWNVHFQVLVLPNLVFQFRDFSQLKINYRFIVFNCDKKKLKNHHKDCNKSWRVEKTWKEVIFSWVICTRMAGRHDSEGSCKSRGPSEYIIE